MKIAIPSKRVLGLVILGQVGHPALIMVYDGFSTHVTQCRGEKNVVIYLRKCGSGYI